MNALQISLNVKTGPSVEMQHVWM